MKRRTIILTLLLLLALMLAVPASALFFSDDTAREPAVESFAKNSVASAVITFSPADLAVDSDNDLTVSSIVINSLPDFGAGTLTMGGEALMTGDVVSSGALSGMQFTPLSSPSVSDTYFTFTPVFSDGVTGDAVTVSLHLLSKANSAPIAENLELSTYKNVPFSGRFKSTDPDGDSVTYQLVDQPARGSITLNDDGSGTFWYTPYENKTGKDTFTYVAVDRVGNTSAEATVKITIRKPDTKVTYADMDGNSSYCSAIRLAEEKVFIGECMDGQYYFQPALSVTRDQFVAMLLSAAGEETLDNISVTGFADDSSIPSWAKSYIASALRSGLVEGCYASDGQMVFNTGAAVTRAEAVVLIDRLLDVTDTAASAETFASGAAPAWCAQSVANLENLGVISTSASLSSPLTRAEAADLLCSMMDVLDARK